MATGMYTSSKRVIRDGKLVAFAGEVMTMDEAVARGLVASSPNGEKKKLKDDWIAEAKALGIDVPKKASVEEIKALIAEHGAKAEEAAETGDGE